MLDFSFSFPRCTSAPEGDRIRLPALQGAVREGQSGQYTPAEWQSYNLQNVNQSENQRSDAERNRSEALRVMT